MHTGKSQQRRPNDRLFASAGMRQKQLPLFALNIPLEQSDQPSSPIIQRIKSGRFFSPDGANRLAALLDRHQRPSSTVLLPPSSAITAGKNTYTYDAHTYHTKVPPQGIVELLKHYLPEGGLVLDPFSGSGMTGVAAKAIGYDCVLNDLSPAACFIARQFTTYVDPEMFRSALHFVISETEAIRRKLYLTHHRKTGELFEFEYTIWSYRVICSLCFYEFTLWDQCRQYGNNVREHKILSEFPCPNCNSRIKKSSLRRTEAVPIAIAYKQSNQIEIHPLDEYDRQIISTQQSGIDLVAGFVPQVRLYPGLNLRQPIKHGLDYVHKFYTARNLAAMSHLWYTIHRIQDDELASQMAFVFTSLYQRVTRFSEFRFWGGSGNTAHFNVPYISKEANVFTTFERKAQTILDHLETTAAQFTGETIIVQSSATSLDYLPDNSVDLIFADPPFGGNINYSEMNIIWEAWLGDFTDATNEAIVNKYQKKSLEDYQKLITQSLSECYRVLREGHWLLLIFMNSAQDVWEALRTSIYEAGFTIRQIDIFDKRHSTFKQLVSENTAGADLILHCQKHGTSQTNMFSAKLAQNTRRSINHFLGTVDIHEFIIRYMHVNRESEVDFRTLYSLWLAQAIARGEDTTDFFDFRTIVNQWIEQRRFQGQ